MNGPGKTTHGEARRRGNGARIAAKLEHVITDVAAAPYVYVN